jgi:hypothetical protein
VTVTIVCCLAARGETDSSNGNGERLLGSPEGKRVVEIVLVYGLSALNRRTALRCRPRASKKESRASERARGTDDEQSPEFEHAAKARADVVHGHAAREQSINIVEASRHSMTTVRRCSHAPEGLPADDRRPLVERAISARVDMSRTLSRFTGS